MALYLGKWCYFTPISGVMTPVITSRGPTLYNQNGILKKNKQTGNFGPTAVKNTSLPGTYAGRPIQRNACCSILIEGIITHFVFFSIDFTRQNLGPQY